MVTFQIILILIFGLGIGVLVFIIIKSFRTPKQMENLQGSVKQGKTQGAIKIAKALIAKDDRDFKAHYYLGKAYLAENKLELALIEFELVNKNAIFDVMDIPEVEFRKESAKLSVKFGHTQNALKEYLLLTKLDPTNADNFYNAGSIFEKAKKNDQALNYYQQAINLNTKHVKAHIGRGMILYHAKQYSEAKKTLEHAIMLNPDVFSSYYYLGKVLKEIKDYSGAINSFEKAMRSPEFRQRSLIERGSCFMIGKNIEKAIEEFGRAIKTSTTESSPETLLARYFLATCYEKQRKIDLALTQWELIRVKNNAFRDVPAKLAEYGELRDNDSIKEYLISSDEEFIKHCKIIIQKNYNLFAQNTSVTKYGCKIIAIEQRGSEWMNARQQLFVVIFYRNSELIEESVLRSLLEEIKKQNYTKGIICTNSEFTRSAIAFAENRPLELVGKEKLQQLLDKAGI